MLQWGGSSRWRHQANHPRCGDTKGLIADRRELLVTPHAAQNIGKRRHSASDARTTSPPGYAVSQGKRKLIEEVRGR